MTEEMKRHPYFCENVFGGLWKFEYFWRNHQRWLAESGYMLRPRYREDWVPSWLTTKEHPLDTEDGECTMGTTTMDATRITDGRIVSIKMVEKSKHPYEEEIIRHLNREQIISDPLNHTVPLLEILQSPLDPNVIFIVMPYLLRIYTVKFATVGEAVECLHQLFKGLKFIHNCGVAHSDITILNVMMDPRPLLSDIPHPIHCSRSYDFKRKVKRHTRTECPTKYYYIDFGLSFIFNPEEEHIAPINLGGDKSVPEFRNPSGMYNPFQADIYTLGNLIREHFIQKSRSLSFMRSLVNDMTQEAPADRPSIEEAFRRFEEICTSVPPWKLRSRYVYRNEFFIGSVYRELRHVVRTITYLKKKYPALPSPKNISLLRIP